MKRVAFLSLMVVAGMLAGCVQTPPDSPGEAMADVSKPPNRVVVYYLHRTFRCASCLWMETTTQQTLQDTFPSELASGRLDFEVEDYMKRKDLAKRFDVQDVAVVVVNVVDGREASHQTLEKAWDLTMKDAEFRAYITESVRAALATQSVRLGVK
jgi:hypothetical protein